MKHPWVLLLVATFFSFQVLASKVPFDACLENLKTLASSLPPDLSRQEKFLEAQKRIANLQHLATTLPPIPIRFFEPIFLWEIMQLQLLWNEEIIMKASADHHHREAMQSIYNDFYQEGGSFIFEKLNQDILSHQPSLETGEALRKEETQKFYSELCRSFAPIELALWPKFKPLIFLRLYLLPYLGPVIHTHSIKKIAPVFQNYLDFIYRYFKIISQDENLREKEADLISKIDEILLAVQK